MKFDLAGFAAHLLTIEKDIKHAQENTVMRGAALIQKRAQSAMGNPKNGFGWPPLAESTIAQKRNGNTPLVETGSLKGSIEISGPYHEPGAVSAYVGTNHPLAAIHEFGTAKIPPRSFIGAATASAEAQIHKIAQREVAKAFAGGHAYHELHQILHAAKRAYEAGKELVESIGEDHEER